MAPLFSRNAKCFPCRQKQKRRRFQIPPVWRAVLKISIFVTDYIEIKMHFQIPTVWRALFENVHFRNRLHRNKDAFSNFSVWKAFLKISIFVTDYIEINMRFQISSAPFSWSLGIRHYTFRTTELVQSTESFSRRAQWYHLQKENLIPCNIIPKLADTTCLQ